MNNDKFIDWWMGKVVPVTFTVVLALIGLSVAALIFSKAL
jgi:hypothetical protein